MASGLVILWQFRHPLPESREQTAGRLIGVAFFALAAFVTFEAVSGLAAGVRPESSPVGIALACASIAIMPILSVAQRRTGRELGSSAVHADGTQTLVCTYLSVVLLVGLLANTTLGWWWFDAVAALIIAALALREGTQAWRGQGCCAPVTEGAVTACDTENPAPAGNWTRRTRLPRRPLLGPAATMADLGAAAATVVYTAAILVLLGVRSWQQYRKTGSAGFNGFRTANSPAARIAGIGFVLAVLAGAASPALAWSHAIPLLWGARPWMTVTGAVLALTGLALGFVAQHTMGTSWRIGVDTAERTDLITHGLFAWIRNPIFTALLIIQLGTTMMAPTWVALIGLVALALACQVQVRLVEEPYLLAAHPASYSRYATRAGRFLPLLGRLHRHDQHLGTNTSTP